MKRNLGRIIILILFILLCVSWIIWLAFGDLFSTENTENRELSALPAFTLAGYADYANEMESYIDDRMPFRNQLISLGHGADYLLFHKTGTDEVIAGKDGWFFILDSMRDYMKNNLYSEEELAEITAEYEKMDDYLEERNGEFILYIAPNKASIYGEYVPDYYGQAEGESKVEQLVSYLREHTDLTVIYPKEELLLAKEEHPELLLYQKLDTHWNYMGGYFAAQPLLEALGKSSKSFEEISYQEINVSDYPWKGYDLASMMGLADLLKEDVNYQIENYSDYSFVRDEDERYDENAFYGSFSTSANSPDSRKVFFARDSFGEALVPFLCSEYKEVYSEHIHQFALEHVAEEEADILIYEICERSL